ncbi:MAG: hypothetical protein R6U11_06655 [Bacteroidales bacterium]
MKKRKLNKISFLLLVVLSLSTISLLADVPQKINYQAIARDASGNLLADEYVDITLSILQGTAEGPAVCIENYDLTTNEFGLVNLQIGSDNPVDFAAINWAEGPYFLKVEINDVVLGTSELVTVPYSLYSETAANAPKGINPGDMSYWDGENWVIIPPGEDGQPLVFCNGVPQWGACNTGDTNSPIFKIENDKGNNVLAAYQGGVEINVDKSYDVPNKTARGGFAVGGFTTEKEFPVTLLDMNIDSTRIFVKENTGVKTARGGFAVGGFTSAKEMTDLFVQITSDTTYIQTTLSSTQDVIIGGDLNIDGTMISSPTLAPTTASSISGFVECFSEVLYNGGSPIVEVGFEFDTSEAFENPIVSIIEITDNFMQLNEDYSLIGLELGETYFVRAYAKNIFHTGYAEPTVLVVE